MALNYVAFGVIVLLLVGVTVAIVALGSLPGKIARRREHPQVDAINAASWISLAGFGVFWPLAFVWAFLRPSAGEAVAVPGSTISADELEQLKERLATLESTWGEIETILKGRSS